MTEKSNPSVSGKRANSQRTTTSGSHSVASCLQSVGLLIPILLYLATTPKFLGVPDPDRKISTDVPEDLPEKRFSRRSGLSSPELKEVLLLEQVTNQGNGNMTVQSPLVEIS